MRGFKCYLPVTSDRAAIFFTVCNVRAATRAMGFFMRCDTDERNDEEIGGTAGIKV